MTWLRVFNNSSLIWQRFTLSSTGNLFNHICHFALDSVLTTLLGLDASWRLTPDSTCPGMQLSICPLVCVSLSQLIQFPSWNSASRTQSSEAPYLSLLRKIPLPASLSNVLIYFSKRTQVCSTEAEKGVSSITLISPFSDLAGWSLA